ncbi:MAG: M23 family metallopeptidase [Spirochaetales bacterium]|nr:M23 family metallopeptidase [Spirochaetales bacterium]
MKRFFAVFFGCLLFWGGTLWGQSNLWVPSSLQAGQAAAVLVWNGTLSPGFRVTIISERGKTLYSAHSFPLPPEMNSQVGVANLQAALLAVDAMTPSQHAFLKVSDARGTAYEFALPIQAGQFPREILHLNRAMSNLREKPSPVVHEQAVSIWDIYLAVHPQAIFQDQSWCLPVKGHPPISSPFGDTRTFIYTDGNEASTYHTGIDFAVVQGTPVWSCGAGKVLLSQNRKLTGETVVIEHWPGVYSDYFHLSKRLVEVGQIVQQNQLVGYSGATGLVTGPHLHWEVRVHGIPVNGENLVHRHLLDKSWILAKIGSADRKRG